MNSIQHDLGMAMAAHTFIRLLEAIQEKTSEETMIKVLHSGIHEMHTLEIAPERFLYEEFKKQMGEDMCKELANTPVFATMFEDFKIRFAKDEVKKTFDNIMALATANEIDTSEIEFNHFIAFLHMVNKP